MKNLFILLFLIIGISVSAQVAINTDGSAPDNSAGLDVKFSDKGFLPPRLTTLQRNEIQSPANGLTIFNTDLNCLEFYAGSANGWYCPCPSSGNLNCVNTVVNGNYLKAVALTSSNNVVLSVTPTSVGGYSISSDNVNGISFSKMGTFTSLGSQTIMLNGTGIPIATGTYTYSVTYNNTSCNFTVTVSSGIPTNCLVGNWPFNGNANDESGNGNHGIVNGATLTTDRFGIANSAYIFDGVNDFIHIPSSASLDITEDITICAWIKLNQISNSRAMIIWRGDAQEIHDPYELHNSYGPVVFRRDVGNGNEVIEAVAPSTNLTTDNFMFIVGRYSSDNNLMEIFIDNVLIDTVTPTSPINYNTSNMWNVIGAVDYGNMQFFTGKIDDIRIYNCALTPLEVTALYNENATLPVVTTEAVSNITQTEATSGGNVSMSGGTAVTSRGICWSTAQNPTINDYHTMEGAGTGTFSSTITGLSPLTTYYVRAYAINSLGIAYGNQESFTTFTCGISHIFDIDGNTYSTVSIGEQCWLGENLKTTKFRNGDSIPYWPNSTTKGYCWYNNDISYKDVYGAIYTFYTATDPRSICPSGWHIPSIEEWATLINYLGGETVAGGKLKEQGTTHWNNPNTGATNSSGFTALPGGTNDCSNNFVLMGSATRFYTSQEAVNGWIMVVSVTSTSSEAIISGGYDCNDFSVRCIKD